MSMVKRKFHPRILIIKIQHVDLRSHADAQWNSAGPNAFAHEQAKIFHFQQSRDVFRRTLTVQDAFKTQGIGRNAQQIELSTVSMAG